MNYRFRNVFATFLGLAALLAVGTAPVFAQSQTVSQFQSVLVQSGLMSTNAGQGLPNLQTNLGAFIQSILGLIGIATFVLIVYAGGLWITAAGNEEKVDQAKRIITGCVIGLVVVFSAYILVHTTILYLQSASTGVPVPGQ